MLLKTVSISSIIITPPHHLSLVIIIMIIVIITIMIIIITIVVGTTLTIIISFCELLPTGRIGFWHFCRLLSQWSLGAVSASPTSAVSLSLLLVLDGCVSHTPVSKDRYQGGQL